MNTVKRETFLSYIFIGFWYR